MAYKCLTFTEEKVEEEMKREKGARETHSIDQATSIGMKGRDGDKSHGQKVITAMGCHEKMFHHSHECRKLVYVVVFWRFAAPSHSLLPRLSLEFPAEPDE